MTTWIERRPKRGRRLIRPASVGMLASMVALGCATTPAPTEQVVASTAAILHAEKEGAPELAAAEMQIARAKLLRVKTAMAAKDYRHALWLAQEAQLDAQLAAAKAQTSKATSATDTAKQDTQAPPDESVRKTHGNCTEGA